MIYNLGMTIGLTVTEMDDMTAGEIFDIAFYKVNQAEKEKNEPKGRKATQADYDSF